MADISMCMAVKRIDGKNVICDLRTSCYRYLAQTGYNQSYFSPPFEVVNNICKCEYFWNVGELMCKTKKK